MIWCLAPMDGITDMVYRTITKLIFDKYNKIDNFFLFTEFMSADGFIHSPTGVCKHIIKNNIENNIFAQIFGGNIENLLKCASHIDHNYNFDGIELNIGCPSPKVIACGGGSGMLKNKNNTLSIIKQLRENIKKKFSIKTRIGLDNFDIQNQYNFIIQASDYCNFIGIHGRTFKQGHSGKVDWEFIYKIKQNCNKNCKIIGNGGISNFEDGIIKKNKLDGIMIGQSAIGNPRIFTNHNPTKQEIYSTIQYHLDLAIGFEIFFKNTINNLINNYDNFNLIMPSLKQIENNYKNYIKDESLRTPIEFRKHLFSYIKGISNSREFKQSIIQIKEYLILKQKIKEFFNY